MGYNYQLGTLNALVRCLWFRDGWGRAHSNPKPPYLQTAEDRLWLRCEVANARVWKAMMAHDAANGKDEPLYCAKCLGAGNGNTLNPLVSQIISILNKPEIQDGFTHEHACCCIYDLLEDYMANG